MCIPTPPVLAGQRSRRQVVKALVVACGCVISVVFFPQKKAATPTRGVGKGLGLPVAPPPQGLPWGPQQQAQHRPGVLRPQRDTSKKKTLPKHRNVERSQIEKGSLPPSPAQSSLGHHCSFQHLSPTPSHCPPTPRALGLQLLPRAVCSKREIRSDPPAVFHSPAKAILTCSCPQGEGEPRW